MKRIRRAWRTLKAHPIRAGLALCLLGVVALNALAARHAWAMTHFVAGGERTPGPEALTLTDKLEALAVGVRVRRPVNTRSPSALGLPFEGLAPGW